MAAPKQLGHLLRESRKKAGKSLKQAGEDVGVSYTYISKLENGIVRPSSEMLERLSEYYDADRDELYIAANKVPSDIDHILASHASAAFALLRKHLGRAK